MKYQQIVKTVIVLVCGLWLAGCNPDNVDRSNGDSAPLKNDNSVFSDICTNDLASALEEALEKMQVACDEYTPI